MQMKGMVAIVTGSSRGLGKAIALAYAAEGATVVACSRPDLPDRPRRHRRRHRRRNPQQRRPSPRHPL